MPNCRSTLAALFAVGALCILPQSSTRRTGRVATSLAEELRIDASRENLSPIGAVTVRRDGVIAITQYQDSRVLIYAASGKRLASFGRQGGGPGEFKNLGAAGLGWLGDTLWVYDPSLRRFTLVTVDGHLVRTVPLPTDLRDPTRDTPLGRRVLTHFKPLAMLPDRSLLGEAQFGELFRTAPTTRPAPTSTSLIAVSASGSVRKELARLPQNHSEVGVSGPRGSVSTQIPFLWPPFRAIAPNGDSFVMAENPVSANLKTSVQVTCVRATGDTAFSVSLAFPQVPISEVARDSAIADRMAVPARVAPALRADLERDMRSVMPASYPPVIGLQLGLDRSVFVELRRTGSERRWLVLSEQGARLGDLVLPPGAKLSHATRTALWVVETDADGLQSVVRYRIVDLR